MDIISVRKSEIKLISYIQDEDKKPFEYHIFIYTNGLQDITYLRFKSKDSFLIARDKCMAKIDEQSISSENINEFLTIEYNI